MYRFLKRHRETLFVAMLGLVIFAALNIMMLFYNYSLWTNPKAGFWTVFWNHFEVSGFDPYTYICISKWRPIYVLTRHPILAALFWPLSELNHWLIDVTGINCAIYIVAVLLTFTSLCSWTLMYRIMRRLMELSFLQSLLLTAFFFSFSHVLIITFVEDHMAFTLPLLLLAVYLGGKAIKSGKMMPLWQSMPLLFFSTGVTTTNCVKIGIADLATRWGRQPFGKLVVHFLLYLLPLGALAGLYYWQTQTTQKQEYANTQHIVDVKMKKDSVFAKEWKKWEVYKKQTKKNQLVHLSFVTNTDYKIDRLPSVVENIFGEGLILHKEHALQDSNRQHRPVLVRYDAWYYYVLEAMIVVLFLAGIWYGRRERLMWMVMEMFLFDMVLHVGLNFASADVYIMTAHWAFVIPVAVAYLFRGAAERPRLQFGLECVVLFLTLFMLIHNTTIIYHHIIG